MATTITTDIDADGIALLTIDVPNQSMNVITPEFFVDLEEAISKLASDAAIKGAVICSGKASGFMAGMDLKYLSNMLREATAEGPEGTDMAALFDRVFTLNALLRK